MTSPNVITRGLRTKSELESERYKEPRSASREGAQSGLRTCSELGSERYEKQRSERSELGSERYKKPQRSERYKKQRSERSELGSERYKEPRPAPRPAPLLRPVGDWRHTSIWSPVTLGSGRHSWASPAELVSSLAPRLSVTCGVGVGGRVVDAVLVSSLALKLSVTCGVGLQLRDAASSKAPTMATCMFSTRQRPRLFFPAVDQLCLHHNTVHALLFQVRLSSSRARLCKSCGLTRFISRCKVGGKLPRNSISYCNQTENCR